MVGDGLEVWEESMDEEKHCYIGGKSGVALVLDVWASQHKPSYQQLAVLVPALGGLAYEC